MAWKEKSYTLDANYYKTAGTYNPKSQHSYSRHMAAEPVRIGTIESEAQNTDFDSQQYRVYSPDGKSVTLCGNGGGVGAKTGLYAIPHRIAEFGKTGGQGQRIYDINAKAVAIRASGCMESIAIPCSGKDYPVYEVVNGQITIKGEQYPIKLPDGYYIIRKLTVKECMRLQTVPDSYIFPVSNTQAYKMLGNGWTVDVIAHILSFVPGITTEEVSVMSMYDGMSCGHIALDKLGARVGKYYATEIDKYAIQTARENYPEMIHLGDAYQVRNEDWYIV